MVDEGWTTVEKKGPKETGGKGGSSRQERSANGGGSGASRATRANQNVHYTKRGKLSHFFFFLSYFRSEIRSPKVLKPSRLASFVVNARTHAVHTSPPRRRLFFRPTFSRGMNPFPRFTKRVDRSLPLFTPSPTHHPRHRWLGRGRRRWEVTVTQRQRGGGWIWRRQTTFFEQQQFYYQ